MSSPGDDEPSAGHDGDGTRKAPNRPVGASNGPDEDPSATPAESDRRVNPPYPEESSSNSNDEFVLFTRDVVISILAVVMLGGYIFMVSGVWPPMVAIESGSMQPNMEENDLVFLMETERFQPDAAHEKTGVVTKETGDAVGYETYGDGGDVIVFAPQGLDQQTPVIHRAMFWVEAGENWCDRAEEEYLSNSERCEEAPHAGFITKGDYNNQYDQSNNQFEPVKPEWVIGTAELRVPRLGWFRLQFQTVIY